MMCFCDYSVNRMGTAHPTGLKCYEFFSLAVAHERGRDARDTGWTYITSLTAWQNRSMLSGVSPATLMRPEPTM